MAGRKREDPEVAARLGAIEQQLTALTGDLETIRPVLTDVGRLEELAERAGRLSSVVEQSVTAMQSTVEAAGLMGARAGPAFNEVYRTDVAGYISAYFTGGRTDTVRLLVGAENPPAECVYIAESRLNTYAGAVVRPGEYWQVRSNVGQQSGFTCTFTPFV